MIEVIDLFSGCGGLSLGFEQAGFRIVKAVEYDKEISNSYKLNHRDTIMVNDDIRNVDNSETFNDCKNVKVIIGGPPCQGFSMAGARIRNGFVDDPRNYLFKHYLNIVKLVKPKIFILENVKGILTINNGKIFEEIKKAFEDPKNFDGHPYKIQYKVMKTVEYGIPQKRERVIIIGSLFDFDLESEIEETRKNILKTNKTFFDKVSVWDAISNLPNPTDDGNVMLNEYNNDYQKYLSSKNRKTYNHITTKHSDKAINRIAKIEINENYKKLDENIKSVHSGSYGRLDPNKPAQTITTRFDTPSGGRFIHPFENRTITPREAARIQSFPDSFRFDGTKTSVCKQIGNAVPPKLSYFFARMIERLLNGQ